MTEMRLTSQQRILALERECAVLHDLVKVLHKMLKEQKEVINDFIVQRVAGPESTSEESEGNGRVEKEVFTFVCRRRFDKLEQDVTRMRKYVENLRFGLKAG
jgi:hypothetical protein